ncbi:MAG: hypothetical protein M1370_01355 [Bacteroidetes bacterium]|nr:hypothetical protein [Bacteroidota bacterium]MCL5025212.1 hypothetical protein [Chloroflexota bacterium]
MAGRPSGEITESTLVETARLAGLPLGPGRVEALLPQLQTLRQELSRLHELDLRDIEPAGIFIAGREGQNG